MRDLFGNEIPEKKKREKRELRDRFKGMCYVAGIPFDEDWPCTEASVAAFIAKAAKAAKVCEHPLCRKFIYLLVSRNGKPIPYTADAVCHFDECPGAPGFRRKKRV